MEHALFALLLCLSSSSSLGGASIGKALFPAATKEQLIKEQATKEQFSKAQSAKEQWIKEPSTKEQSTLAKNDLRGKEKRILAKDLSQAEEKLFVGHIPDIEDVGVFHPIPVPSFFEVSLEGLPCIL